MKSKIFPVLGFLLAFFTVGLRQAYSHEQESMAKQMGEMNDTLMMKSGDDFDKAFLSEMIAHHQGAIDMAKAAKTKAKHEEIKKMADDIINAQTREIETMKQWQKDWEY